MITKNLITTKPNYFLEGDQVIVNLEEALDLALVIPYSPFSSSYLKRIIPY